MIVTYIGASYANLPDAGSQERQNISFTDDKMFTEIKRVVKCMLEETLSFIDVCEMLLLMAKIIVEIVYNDKNFTLSVHCKVDSKSLCEEAKTIKRISDIKLQVKISIVQEMTEKEEVTLQSSE